MRKILFSRDSECIQPIRTLIEQQKHRTLVLWALECAPRVLAIFENQYPDEKRPRIALEMALAWARGEIKMPAAKRAIHAAHNAATEAEAFPAAQAAARAMGHAAATVHVETHALGLVFYGLTAFIYAEGLEHYDTVVKRECDFFYVRLLYWQDHIDTVDMPWAGFLLKDDVPNKERLLRLKSQRKF